nr:MAG TPA: protein of unknown function (DUF4428) [Caudoviricetes sp.]
MMDLDDPRILQIERTGYLSRCEPIAYRCECCKSAIYDGDEYIEDEVTGDAYCEDCFKERFRHRTA